MVLVCVQKVFACTQQDVCIYMYAVVLVHVYMFSVKVSYA